MTNKEFEERIDKLFAENSKDLTDEYRINAVEDLLEEYMITSNYVKPPVKLLDRLANYLLSPDHMDKKKNKVRNTEYSFLSKDQENRRRRKEVSIGEEKTIDYLDQKYNRGESNTVDKSDKVENANLKSSKYRNKRDPYYD